MTTERNIWFMSDPHFNHAKILTFTDEKGGSIRPFQTVKEMNEAMCDNIVDAVKPNDYLYFMGDLFFGDKAAGHEIIRKLPGLKRLVVGNHDDIPSIAASGIFKKIMLWRVFGEYGFIVSHIPIHPDSLMKGGRTLMNAHGHIHERLVMGQDGTQDIRYFNLCVEQWNYKPVPLSVIAMEARNTRIELYDQ